MQPDVERLFHELADLTPRERSGYYLEHDVNEQTRLEVERLLSFDRETPIVDAAAGVVAEALLRDDDSFNVGLRCGPYRLDDVIGRGGMGTVYRAERVDGEITQRAAVKLLRIVGSGPAWRERFARERQFLASLSHDSIVRLLDAGHTEDGQPYLAMELVEGLPIDQYAGAANASSKGIRHLLEVFLRVCDGVAHAHRNLVIHRDLKPSNILVDEAGNPKLLDFGIAKLTEDAADPTQTADRLLSPLYASPEQFTGARQTTVSDVYSLGAILYRILTGRSPHESAEGGFAGEILLGELKIRAPREVNRSLPLDLSYVLMRALRRDPDERYSSVTDLSQDLQCFLNNQPVSARPDSLLYRAGRFIRRNSIAVATAATVAIALAATSAVAIRESINARTRFNQLRKVARTVLFEFNDELDRVPGTTRAKALLMATSREYLDNLARSAGDDHSLLLDLAEAYERLASLQGGAAAGNLGQHIDALASRRAALEIRRRINAKNPQEEALFVNSLAATSDLLRNLGQLSEALNVGREALAKASGLLKNEDSQILFARITAHQALSRVLIDLNRMEEAESELGRAEKLVPLNLPAAFRLRVNNRPRRCAAKPGAGA